MIKNKPEVALIYNYKDNDSLMGMYLFSKQYLNEVNVDKFVFIPYYYDEKNEWEKNSIFSEFIFIGVTPSIKWLKEKEKTPDTFSSIKIYHNSSPDYLRDILEEFLYINSSHRTKLHYLSL